MLVFYLFLMAVGAGLFWSGMQAARAANDFYRIGQVLRDLGVSRMRSERADHMARLTTPTTTERKE